MAAPRADIPRAVPVNVWRVVRDALTGHRERWDRDTDDTIRYLRQQSREAQERAEWLRAERLRRERFPIADMIRQGER